MNGILKSILFLPLLFVRAVMPINAVTYRPSTEQQRKDSEEIRNAYRRLDYEAKKKLFKF